MVLYGNRYRSLWSCRPLGRLVAGSLDHRASESVYDDRTIFLLVHEDCPFLRHWLFVDVRFALKIAHLKDSELRKLVADLPLRTIEAKAPSTTDRYSRAFQKFREWSSPYNEVVCLPTDEISVALYLESLIQGGSPYSSLESACYGINWAHNLYGFQSPCDSKLVKNVLEAAKRSLAKPVSKKEPVTPDCRYL